MLTNWKTISKSIKKMREMEQILEDEKNPETVSKYNKKELLDIDRKRAKMEASLGGIRDMGGKPDLIFIIDTNKEKIAIQEAKMLGIPVVAVVDTNSSLDDVDFPIPGNDDASRAIKFYCDLVAKAITVGAEAARIDHEEKNLVGSLSESLKSEDDVDSAEVAAKSDEKSVLKAKKSSEKASSKEEKPKAEKKEVAPKKKSEEKKEVVAKKKEEPKKKVAAKKTTEAVKKTATKAKKSDEKETKAKKSTAKKEK